MFTGGLGRHYRMLNRYTDAQPQRQIQGVLMQNVSQLRPLVMAVSGALALMATAGHAQTFDPNSAAVRQAYVGVATQEKRDAALTGLGLLVSQVRQNVSAGGFGGSFGFILGSSSSSYLWQSFNFGVSGTLTDNTGGLALFIPRYTPLQFSLSTLQAVNDGDLGVPGAAVTLNNSTLRTLSSFNTTRNFTIGAGGAIIDTNGFDFGISGAVTANGTLFKDGLGTLSLTGNNVWFQQPIVANGVLEGNTTSLQTSILNNATVRFNQATDGIYNGSITTSTTGNFEKSGSGKLTLTGGNLYGGTTTILGGTLALSGYGTLGSTTELRISSGATFDFSSAQTTTHNVGLLSGSGNVVLGSNRLSSGASGDSTFAGSISGTGGLRKADSGKLTLTGINSYTGSTLLNGGTLALEGQGRLSGSSSINIMQGTFDIAGADGAREAGSIAGDGSIRLGANTLTVGRDNTSNTYNGIISGGGGLTKTGTGSLTLTGANAYTGATTINQGELIARAQSISASVVNNAALTLTEDGSATYAGVVSGTGLLNKSGSGTLTLTGANTYTGATNIAAGTLALAAQGRLNAASSLAISSGAFDISGAAGNQEVGSIEGHGIIQLGANTLTAGRNNSNNIFDGSIVGGGGITKTGTGSLTLSGASTYTGVTAINQGNLIAKTYSISERVTNNATLTMTEEKGTNTSFISAYSGNISGTGQLIKEGDGIIWLRGRNSYNGGTTVNAGYLVGNTDSLQGNITNNAALAFYQVDNGTYAGTLSGSGSLLQYGPGVLTLTGNNTYTGGTAFSGTLRVDRDANLGAASGALVMAGGTLQIGADMTTARNIVLAPAGGTIDTNGYKLSASGILAGNGELTKTGAGTLSLDGHNMYVGATSVNAGRLEVNGPVVSNVAVAAGAELGGTGFIAGNVINSGRLSRGNGIGDIYVAGSTTFAPGSVFTVKADAAGNSDRLVLSTITLQPGPLGVSALTARAILNGGMVDVRAENGNYRSETRYGIVNAQGGVSGQFASVTSNLAFLDPSLSYDPNNVYLTLRRNDINYAAVAQNPNQSAVAQSLTRMTTVTTGDASTVTSALDGLSASQARAAFDSIGAAGRAVLPQVGTFNQRSVSQSLVARLGIAEGGNTLAPATGLAGRAVQIAFDERIRSDAPSIYAQAMVPGSGQGLRAGTSSDTNNGLWLRGYGGAGRLDGDSNAPGAKYNFGGTLFGYDRKVSEGAIVGVFGGYAEPRYNQDIATSSAHAKTYQLGGYGRLNSGAWHVDGAASYARNSTDTSRIVTVGALNRAAAGSFKGDTVAVHIETGYTIKASGFDVQPLAALSWVKQTQNAYSETGAGALNLVLPDQSQQSLRSTVGVRSLLPFQAGATSVVFEARAAWSHEFNNTRSVNARLAGDPAASVFTVSGPALPRDTAVAGIGIAAQASRNLRLYADVSGEFNGRERAGTLSVGLRYQW